MNLGTQLWIGKTTPTSDALIQVKNRTFPWCKPDRSGLWTSTYHEQHGSGWVRWCLAESFDIPADDLWRGYVLYPADTARIAVIDNPHDLNRLIRRYPHELMESSYHSRHLDFEALSQEFDGLHLTEGGQWETRLSTPYDLYGWDTASTLWFRWCFDRVEPLTPTAFDLATGRAVYA